MINSNRITLEDVFLCEPISKRGRNALKRIDSIDGTKTMTIKEFYEEIFVQPYFVNFVENEEDVHHKSPNLYDNFSFSELGLNTKNLNDTKERYESKFFSMNTDYVMFIRASAGSGKSIYLNYLKRERRKKYFKDNINTDFSNGLINEAYELSFDLESSKSSLQFGEVTFPSETYKIKSGNITDVDSPWHFFNMLLDSITQMSWDIIQKNSIEKKNRIEKNFKTIYGFDYSDSIYKLYKLLTDDNNSLDPRTIRTDLFKNVIEASFIDPNDVSICIGKALETLARLITIQSDLLNPKQVLIAFDNIEHFINSQKRIFDDDIKKITSAVINFAEDENNYYDTLNLDFSQFFKIILVVRDTTSKMLSGDVHSKFNRDDCSIDVTGWFPLEKIYSNKLQYYGIDETNSISVQFFNLIINESLRKNKNNLMEQISIMYNHNNRRTTRMLARVAGIFEHKEEHPNNNKKSLNYEQYCKLWKWHKKMHIKYLCRQSVLRLIYNEVATTNYFSNIFSNIEKCETEKNTYAMRVLTWLSNQGSHKSEDYYSYYSLVKNIICNPAVTKCNAVSYSELLDFADVLIALDEHRFDATHANNYSMIGTQPNCWCQLIIIKHNSINVHNGLNRDLLAKELHKQFCSGIDSNESYGIRLTEAGYFYARMLRDFEYFACMYEDSNVPLIFMTDPQQIKDTISCVAKKAKKYIDNCLWFEYRHFNRQYSAAYENFYHLKHITNSKNEEYQSLAYRIFLQHSAYLGAYQLYLKDDILHEELKAFDNETRNDLIKFVKKQIKEYVGIYRMLKNNKYKIDNNLIVSKYVLKQSEKIKM